MQKFPSVVKLHDVPSKRLASTVALAAIDFKLGCSPAAGTNAVAEMVEDRHAPWQLDNRLPHLRSVMEELWPLGAQAAQNDVRSNVSY